MSKRRDPNASKFVPCVATHFLHRSMNMVKRLSDIKDGIGEYDGLKEAELAQALEAAAPGLQRIAEILNARSSNPVDLPWALPLPEVQEFTEEQSTDEVPADTQ